MEEVDLFATLHVSDFATARAWYERLLGEVSFDAHATESVWMVGAHAGIAVHEHAPAGNGSVTLFCADLDAALREIAQRGGLTPDETETYSNGVRKAIFRDPDGNELGFGGPPTS
jgi:predicted enzyme related to lactoylglutathione lyase